MDQTIQHERTRISYGGSDNTAASFIRPQYVKYNSISKSRDLGALDNLNAMISGTIGGRVGTQTLFFKVRTSGTSRLGYVLFDSNRFTDQHLEIGISDADRRPMQIGLSGFAFESEVHNSTAVQPNELMPPGEYYFTIASSQWQEIPYAVMFTVQRFVVLQGVSTQTLIAQLRLGLAKLIGHSTNTAILSASIRNPRTVRNLQGGAGGEAIPRLTLTIMRGSAVLSLPVYGRLKQTWRLSGRASGTASGVATMSAGRPYGYGY